MCPCVLIPGTKTQGHIKEKDKVKDKDVDFTVKNQQQIVYPVGLKSRLRVTQLIENGTIG